MTSQDTQAQSMVVVIRDHDGCWFLEHVDDWDTTTLLASVSSDPRSFRELSLSWERYREQEPLQNLAWREYKPSETSPLGNWLLIDLANLRVESNYEDAVPETAGAYQRDEGYWTPENPLVWLNLPPSWQRVISTQSRPDVRPLSERREDLDFRGVLFGRAMTEDFANRMRGVASRQSLPSEYYTWDELGPEESAADSKREVIKRWNELAKQIHAEWLMTPREDLDGETPRVFLHRGRSWVEREIQNRMEQWSRFRTPPCALDRDTHSWVHGPMGRDEVVVYFDLCREVIHAGWKMLLKSPQLLDNPSHWAAAMYDHGRSWLNNGSIDGSPTPPAKIIEASRCHMPVVASSEHFDCDCPLCRMMADDQGTLPPAFSGFDGHHLELEDEFAFSLCETLDEWEEEQRLWSERLSNSDAALSRKNETGATASDSDSVWQGFVNNDEIGLSIIGLGFRLAELISDLKRQKDSRDSIKALNDAFDFIRKSSYYTS
jgi:hypothetical protein